MTGDRVVDVGAKYMKNMKLDAIFRGDDIKLTKQQKCALHTLDPGFPIVVYLRPNLFPIDDLYLTEHPVDTDVFFVGNVSQTQYLILDMTVEEFDHWVDTHNLGSSWSWLMNDVHYYISDFVPSQVRSDLFYVSGGFFPAFPGHYVMPFREGTFQVETLWPDEAVIGTTRITQTSSGCGTSYRHPNVIPVEIEAMLAWGWYSQFTSVMTTKNFALNVVASVDCYLPNKKTPFFGLMPEVDASKRTLLGKVDGCSIQAAYFRKVHSAMTAKYPAMEGFLASLPAPYDLSQLEQSLAFLYEHCYKEQYSWLNLLLV